MDQELITPDELVHALGLAVVLIDVLYGIRALLARGFVDEAGVCTLLADFVAFVANWMQKIEHFQRTALFSWLALELE